jgi:hypothetical protein
MGLLITLLMRRWQFLGYGVRAEAVAILSHITLEQ